jgi:hypothetical protein
VHLTTADGLLFGYLKPFNPTDISRWVEALRLPPAIFFLGRVYPLYRGDYAAFEGLQHRLRKHVLPGIIAFTRSVADIAHVMPPAWAAVITGWGTAGGGQAGKKITRVVGVGARMDIRGDAIARPPDDGEGCWSVAPQAHSLLGWQPRQSSQSHRDRWQVGDS